MYNIDYQIQDVYFLHHSFLFIISYESKILNRVKISQKNGVVNLITDYRIDAVNLRDRIIACISRLLGCKSGYPGLPTPGPPGYFYSLYQPPGGPGVGNPGCRRRRRRRRRRTGVSDARGYQRKKLSNQIVGNPGCW